MWPLALIFCSGIFIYVGLLLLNVLDGTRATNGTRRLASACFYQVDYSSWKKGKATPFLSVIGSLAVKIILCCKKFRWHNLHFYSKFSKIDYISTSYTSTNIWSQRKQLKQFLSEYLRLSLADKQRQFACERTPWFQQTPRSLDEKQVGSQSVLKLCMLELLGQIISISKRPRQLNSF